MRNKERIKPIMEYVKNDFADSGEDNFIAYLIIRGILPNEFAMENDISYGEFIDNAVLEEVETEWMKHQDYRFAQIIIACGIVPNIYGGWFYAEDNELFDDHEFKRIIHVWGTYGRTGSQEYKTVSVSEMSIGHMKKILLLIYASKGIKKLIRNEIKFRR